MIAEGITTGAYRYARYFTGERKPKHELKRVAVLVDEQAEAGGARRAVGGPRARRIGESRARSGQQPAERPDRDRVREHRRRRGQEARPPCKVFDKKAIEKLGMPLLLAVNRGSTEEPRFFHITYKPQGKSAAKVAFVGKGLTFDSGGLCLKTADGMLDMKMDMAGAAATVGDRARGRALELPVEVHGDRRVHRQHERRQRLPARRRVSVARRQERRDHQHRRRGPAGAGRRARLRARARSPTISIDHATLTGACMVALGSYRAGLFSNDDALRQAYEKAAAASGEQFWAMPLDEDLRDQLKSTIADLKHTGSRYGGSITAALFLREFVGKSRWMHLDIAGPAYLADGRGIHPKGGTGFGVITAVEFLRGLTQAPSAS